jgi:hypothetical protein
MQRAIGRSPSAPFFPNGTIQWPGDSDEHHRPYLFSEYKLAIPPRGATAFAADTIGNPHAFIQNDEI